jgi:hypothetical protein
MLDNPRPGILTAACVMSLIIAGLSVLVWAIAAIVMAFDKTPYPNSVRAFQWAMLPISMVTTVMLAWGAIAALALKPIGRTLLILYCWIDLAIQTFSAAGHVLWEVPVTLKYEKKSSVDPALMKVLAYGGYATGWVLMVAFIIALLIVLYRPRVKAAFEGASTQSPA